MGVQQPRHLLKTHRWDAQISYALSGIIRLLKVITIALTGNYRKSTRRGVNRQQADPKQLFSRRRRLRPLRWWFILLLLVSYHRLDSGGRPHATYRDMLTLLQVRAV
jgi:hypothetical protein